MEMDEREPRWSGVFTGGVETLSHSREPFQVTVRGESDGVTVLSIRGELDIAAERPLRELVGAFVARNGPNVVLDLSGVTFCDMSGLQALHLCGEDTCALGGTLVLAGSPDRMLWLLEVSGLGRVFAPVVCAPDRDGSPLRCPSGSSGAEESLPAPFASTSRPLSRQMATYLLPGGGQSLN